MRPPRLRILVLALVAALAAACGSGAPSATTTPTPTTVPTPTAPPAATSFSEYGVAFCSAFQALFRAVGNPDTAEGSELSHGLDAAVAAHDGETAVRLAGNIKAELEAGRRQAKVGAGWAPAAPTMVQLDRLLVAFEAMTDAKVAKAKGDPNADPQAALERSGGLEAWTGMLTAWGAMAADRPANVQPCANVPINP